MSNPLIISSALWIGTGTLGMVWGLSQPYPSINKFYGFGMGAIASVIGTVLTYPAMKRVERTTIRQSTADQIFDIGEAATIERYKQAVFPVPPMPDLNIYNHIMGMMPGEEPLDLPPMVDFNSILDRGVGICLFGDSGSGKSCTAKYLIGQSSRGAGCKLIVADPHYDGSGDWGQDALIVDDYPLILKVLRAALDELDRRKVQRKQGVKQFPRLTFIWDEWPSVRVAAKQAKSNICEEAVIRLGSECRKYDMLSIFCSQSGNTKAMGLEGMGDFLQNFSLIRLGKIAIKHAKNLPDQRILSCLQSVGYPCLVDDDLSTHPTHGSYQHFKNGQPPQNLTQINSLPITLNELMGDFVESETVKETPKQPPKIQGINLEKKPENNTNPDDKFMQILEFCKGKESVSVRDIQRSSVGRNLSSDAVRYAFQWLADNGHGEISEEQTGGTVRVSFTPF